MNWLINHPLTSFTYGFLYLTVISLWFPKVKKVPLWPIFLIISTIFALISKRLDLVGIPFLVLLALATASLRNNALPTSVRVVSALVLFLLGAGLETHHIPGFHNLNVLHQVYISQDAVPFTLYLNFDKTMVGLFILGLLHSRISSKCEWLHMFKQMLPRLFIVIIVVAYLGFLLKYIRFDVKLPDSFLIWAMTNLLFVCVAEEGFFRGFIQKYLCGIFQSIKYGNLIAILIASILFGLSHYMGGIKYIILATVAGIGYGWIYFRTQRIEASIISHFSLNLIHFLFFTYPALAVT